MQYSNFKDTLQNIASQIGNVEQEVEEHKYVVNSLESQDRCNLRLHGIRKFSFDYSKVTSRQLDHQYNILLKSKHEC